MSDVAVAEKARSAEPMTATGPVKYSMVGTKLLSSGATTGALAIAENLWVHSKVYSGGGENALHAHPFEEHTFFVLQGRAEFEFEGGRKIVADRFDGMLIPKGVLYKFQAMGGENLVMIRVGAAQRDPNWSGEVYRGLPAELGYVVDEKGDKVTDYSSAAKGRTHVEPVVPIPGAVFGRT